MSPIDLTKVFQKHRGKWIALKQGGNQVLASGVNAKSVLNAAKEKSKHPVLFFVPTKLLPYVGSFS